MEFRDGHMATIYHDLFLYSVLGASPHMFTQSGSIKGINDEPNRLVKRPVILDEAHRVFGGFTAPQFIV